MLCSVSETSLLWSYTITLGFEFLYPSFGVDCGHICSQMTWRCHWRSTWKGWVPESFAACFGGKGLTEGEMPWKGNYRVCFCFIKEFWFILKGYKYAVLDTKLNKWTSLDYNTLEESRLDALPSPSLSVSPKKCLKKMSAILKAKYYQKKGLRGKETCGGAFAKKFHQCTSTPTLHLSRLLISGPNASVRASWLCCCGQRIALSPGSYLEHCTKGAGLARSRPGGVLWDAQERADNGDGGGGRWKRSRLLRGCSAASCCGGGSEPAWMTELLLFWNVAYSR